MPNLTMLDLAKMRGTDQAVGLIEEVVNATPEVRVLPVRPMPGLTYEVLRRVSYPTVGFRQANKAPTTSRSEYVRDVVQCFFLNPRWEADKMVADSDPMGAAHVMNMEGLGQVEAALLSFSRQFYYGGDVDANGFAGLAQLHDTNLVVDATGTTASTGSSVWMVYAGLRGLHIPMGNNGSWGMPEMRIGDIKDADGNLLTGYIQEMMAYPGLQLGPKWAAVRIKNLTEDSGKGLTVNLMRKAFAKFPSGVNPTHIFMTKRSRRQLAESTTPSSTPTQPYPLSMAPSMPTFFESVPIYETNGITDTEAIA
jgi:hypothetical protein